MIQGVLIGLAWILLFPQPAYGQHYLCDDFDDELTEAISSASKDCDSFEEFLEEIRPALEKHFWERVEISCDQERCVVIAYHASHSSLFMYELREYNIQGPYDRQD